MIGSRRIWTAATLWIGGIAATMVIVLGFASGAGAKPEASEAKYLSPGEMIFSADGRSIYVVCEKSNELLVVDSKLGKVARRIEVGSNPRGIALSPKGDQILVTNSWDDTVSVIDAGTLKIVRTLHTGFEPIGIAIDHSGQTIYTANRLSNDISVIDAQTGEERKRIAAGRGASYLTLSPDGKLLYCTHVYPNIKARRGPPQSEITVIDTTSQIVINRLPLNNVAGVFHLALSPDGKFGVAAQLRPKNLIPLAHVEHGYVFGNSLALFGNGISGAVQLPLDELERYFPMPYGVAITPDKSKMYVTSGGSSMLTVISVPKFLSFARTAPADVANDLSAAANYVLARINVGTNPRGLLLSPNGRYLYVSQRMDDTIGVIDTRTDKVVSTIDLGGRKDYNSLRRGERLFYNTSYSFQGHFSCANCHVDATFDGLEWDLEPDGFGKDIVDNRLIEDLSGTEPFKWNGGNPTMAQECGPRTEMYFYRSQSYNSAELADLVSFIFALPLRPNRYRAPAGELTASQERGKRIFERATDKTGKPIPVENQCAYCHSGPKYTNQKQFDVGSAKPTDRSPVIDVPQLTNVAYTAPYLHDGSATSMEEIWTMFNPHDTHGVTNDLTKDELNDLIEYLRTL
jgi:YVTN family beta-propeller protein